MSLDLFKISGTVISVAKYIEGGGIEKDLASLELYAAKDALHKSKAALDKRSQIWSVINHLETAEASLYKSVTSRKQMRIALNGFSRDVDISYLFDVCLMMASCYIYLDEHGLALKLIARAEGCYRLILEFNWAEVVHLFSGMLFVSAYSDFRERDPYTGEDIENKLKPSVQNLRNVMIYKLMQDVLKKKLKQKQPKQSKAKRRKALMDDVRWHNVPRKR